MRGRVRIDYLNEGGSHLIGFEAVVPRPFERDVQTQHTASASASSASPYSSTVCFHATTASTATHSSRTSTSTYTSACADWHLLPVAAMIVPALVLIVGAAALAREGRGCQDLGLELNYRYSSVADHFDGLCGHPLFFGEAPGKTLQAK